MSYLYTYCRTSDITTWSMGTAVLVLELHIYLPNNVLVPRCMCVRL